jgi:molybdopterin molybdotransferase
MKDVGEARSIVLDHAKRLPAETTACMTAALGMIVAEDVRADLDSPPFAKSMMDGFAVRTAGAPFETPLEIVETVAAGTMPTKPVGAGQCSRILTGAPMPTGADAVVMVEKSTVESDGRVRLRDAEIGPGRNVIARGQEMKAGDVVVPAGTPLSPASFGLIASCGRTAVHCYRQPKVSLICTGNEVVEANRKPAGAQIRNSNGPMLTAQTVRAGALPRYLGIGLDDDTMLRSLIEEGLQTSHVTVLAGGVSAGQLDLVPGVLAKLGVTIHFHKVRMKPGKPLLFGTRGDRMVFGLPGNPVSAYVGFELFVRPALDRLGGKPDSTSKPVELPLAESLSTNNDRPTYHPAMVNHDSVTPLPWFGSADLRGLLNANALIVVPEGPVVRMAGERVPVLPIA